MTTDEERDLLTAKIAQLDAAVLEMTNYRSELQVILDNLGVIDEDDDVDDNDGPGSN